LVSTLKGFATSGDPVSTNPFRVTLTITYLIPGLPKLNPGLELANTFGVTANTFGVIANTFGVIGTPSV
jgi:hypothetical protein